MTWTPILFAVVCLVLCGFGMLAMGFQFVPNATEQFFNKLPVFLLVALLIERTVEIFLTIWRGGDAVKMETNLNRLIALKQAQSVRPAKLAELGQKIADADNAISALQGVVGKDTELKIQQDLKLDLAKQKLELEAAGLKETNEISALELGGIVEVRTNALLDYKSETRNVAMTSSLVLALLIAACGFRTVEGLVVLAPSAPPVPKATAKDVAATKELTENVIKRINADRESMAKTGKDSLEILRRQQDESLTSWLEKELNEKLTAASTNSLPVSPNAAKDEKSLATQTMFFRFLDVLLTAGLLAGGADPISRVMKLLRDFLDQSNKQIKEEKK